MFKFALCYVILILNSIYAYSNEVTPFWSIDIDKKNNRTNQFPSQLPLINATEGTTFNLSITINKDSFSALNIGTKISIPTSDFETIEFRIKNIIRSNKSTTYIASMNDKKYGLSLTKTPVGIHVTLRTAKNNWQGFIVNNRGTLTNEKLLSEQIDQNKADYLIPSKPNDKTQQTVKEFSSRHGAPTLIKKEQLNIKTKIDVLVVYSQTANNIYSGDINGRIEHMLTVTNQIYNDSNVNIELSLAKAIEVNYDDNSSSNKALDDITNQVGVFSNIETTRQSIGADLVVLLRPSINDGYCGLAWLNGGNASITGYKNYMYSHVVVDCPDYVLAHEIGHNLGLAHSVAQGDTGATFNYARGHGVTNEFATVMAYQSAYNATKLYFHSDPTNFSCNNFPCGVDQEIDPINGANAVSALNQIASQASEFYTALDSDNDGIPDNQDNCINTSNVNQLNTDGDDFGDSCDLDDDNDGMPDEYETLNSLDPLDPNDAALDTDGDGLSHFEEYNLGTDPNNKDSDGDGVTDKWDSSPLDPNLGNASQLDSNTNNIEEIVFAATKNNQNMAVFVEAKSGEIIGEMSTAWLNGKTVLTVPDVNGNGVWDVVILGETPAGAVTWQLFDGRWKNRLHTNMYPNWFKPKTQKQVLSLPDINGNNRAELVILIEHANERDGFIVYDLSTRSIITTVWLPTWFNADNMMAVNDWTGNGANELIFSGKTSSNQSVWFRYDSLTGANLGYKAQPGWLTTSQSYMGADINNNGIESVISLGTSPSGAHLWIAQDAFTGLEVKRLVFPSWFIASELAMINDPNGDGLSDVAALGVTSGGYNITRINDVWNGILISQIVYGTWYTPNQNNSLKVIQDTNNNGELDLLTLSYNLSNIPLWVKHDVNSGQALSIFNIFNEGYTLH